MSRTYTEDHTHPLLVNWQRELTKPLSGWLCLTSWILASAIFVGLVALFGGPTPDDASQSFYSTWAIAHGALACSYPPASSASFSLNLIPAPSTPPLWPFLSGGLAALFGIGHAVPFPTQHAMGENCLLGYTKMAQWSTVSGSLSSTLDLGYAAWFALLAGFVALLRAAGRGHTRWEAFGALFLAVVPIVWMPLLYEFHPQDFVALGLGLAGTACGIRGRWLWAGVFLGLAITSQQFGVLFLIPLAVVAPRMDRVRLLVASGVAVVVISAPILVASSGRAIHSVLVGTGDSTTLGGTVLSKLLSHPSGYVTARTTPLVVTSRLGPIVVALVLAWWAHRRLGPRATEPVPLVSLVATSLSMRLVFEEGLFGYKFLCLAVLLIVLDILRGRLRGRLVAWIALVSMAFNPIHYFDPTRWWPTDAATALPLICIAVVLCVVARDVIHRRVHWYLLAWLAIALYGFIRWPVWIPKGFPAPYPLWFWQVILVGSGVIMAVSPLVASIRGATRSESGVDALT